MACSSSPLTTTRTLQDLHGAVALAALAALADTVLPSIRVVGLDRGSKGGPNGGDVDADRDSDHAMDLGNDNDNDSNNDNDNDNGNGNGEAEGEDALKGFGKGVGVDFEVDDDPAAGVALSVSSVPLCVTLAHIGATGSHEVGFLGGRAAPCVLG